MIQEIEYKLVRIQINQQPSGGRPRVERSEVSRVTSHETPLVTFLGENVVPNHDFS